MVSPVSFKGMGSKELPTGHQGLRAGRKQPSRAFSSRRYGHRSAPRGKVYTAGCKDVPLRMAKRKGYVRLTRISTLEAYTLPLHYRDGVPDLTGRLLSFEQ